MGQIANPDDDVINNNNNATSTHDIVGRMIDVSQASTADKIAIVGTNRVDMLLDLCQRGFAEVGRVGASGVGVIDQVDVLWVPDVGGERDLASVLGRVGRRVHAGGTIVLHDARPAPDRTRNRRVRDLRKFLSDGGFLCLNQESNGGSGFLLTAQARRRWSRPTPRRGVRRCSR